MCTITLYMQVQTAKDGCAMILVAVTFLLFLYFFLLYRFIVLLTGGTGRRSRPASAGQTRPSSAYSNTSTGKRRPNSASTSRPLSATSIRPKSATNSKRPEWQSGW